MPSAWASSSLPRARQRRRANGVDPCSSRVSSSPPCFAICGETNGGRFGQGKMTTHLAILRMPCERRRDRAAPLLGARTARVKLTAFGPRHDARNLALDGEIAPALPGIGNGLGFDQRARIGMERIAEDLLGRSGLDEA